MFTYHVIHLSNAEIVCLPWRFGRPVAEHRFANDEAGLAAFSTYLRDWQNIPTRIVVDLIEEDFRVETLPHLRGRDRRVVLERRLSQLYRATPFRLAVLQGRETTGRRDDIALCTAITQNESLVACLDVLGRWRIPVLGVHPAALLGEALLRALRVDAEQLVLVTLLQPDTLRISFFQKGRLRFSRISQPVIDGEGGLAAELREEVRRTLQYVSSQSWYLRSAPVRTLLVADTPEVETLSSVWNDSEPALQVISPRTIATRLRLRARPTRSNATGVLLHLLMKQAPRAQLAPAERTRDGRLWYLRSGLFALSGLLVLAAMLLAGANLFNALEVRSDSARVAAALDTRRAEIAHTQGKLPPSTVSPDRMSALVRFARNDVEAVPRLLPFLHVLADALDRSPGIRLRSLVWTTDTRPPRPETPPALPSAGAVGSERSPAPSGGLAHRTFFQDIRIEGEALDAQRDPGRLLEDVDHFAEAVRGQGLQVRISRTPFDFRPSSPLTSRSFDARTRAPEFVLHVYGPAAP